MENFKQYIEKFNYPIAGKYVDGRIVDSNVDNYSSISSSFYKDEIEILNGIREVPMSIFNSKKITDLFHSSDDIKRCKSLALKIKESNTISTLIVVIDKDSTKEGPYLLEGGHRFGALLELKAKSFPAIVVIHNE